MLQTGDGFLNPQGARCSTSITPHRATWPKSSATISPTPSSGLRSKCLRAAWTPKRGSLRLTRAQPCFLGHSMFLTIRPPPKVRFCENEGAERTDFVIPQLAHPFRSAFGGLASHNSQSMTGGISPSEHPGRAVNFDARRLKPTSAPEF